MSSTNQIISSRNGVREERQHGGKYYGSTTQHAGDERQQNAQRNNINTGEVHREVIQRLQDQPCSR